MRDSSNVLNSLAGHSSDLNYKFERLYRLLFNENLYALAYQNIASSDGNCTKGADGQSISGMSVERIQNIINKLKAINLIQLKEFTFPKRMARNVH